MPRQYDFAAERSPENYDKWGLFVPFLADGESRPVFGRSEVTLKDLWGDRSFLEGVRHQYGLKTPPGVSPYDNPFVDEIHEWLSDNVGGQWNWLEHVINNGRSLATDVYVEEADDQTAFERRWGEVFERREYAFEQNAKLTASKAPAPR